MTRLATALLAGAVIHAAPAPPPLQGAAAFAARVRTAVRSILNAHACEPGLGADVAQPLSAAEAVVFLGCQTGAYQRAFLAFRAPRSEPERATLLITGRLPGLPKGSWGETGLFVEPEYDPPTAELTTFAKDRADAACGLSATWVFDSKTFRLAEMTRGDACDPHIGWNLVYKAKVVPAPER